MKTMFFVMMIAFGVTSIISAVLTFASESLIINHEPMMATLFFGGGFGGLCSGLLYEFKG
jgi:hypothetical protein